MKDIETQEELEKLVEPKKQKIADFEVTKYGEDSNRVMILTLGKKSDYTDKLARIISLTTLPIGYQIIRIDGENIQDKIREVYNSVRKEPVLKEALEIKKRIGFKNTKNPDVKYLKEKYIYSFSYKNLVQETIEAFRSINNVKVKRFYFVSPMFENEDTYKKLSWIDEAEILISSDDKNIIGKRCKKLASLYKMHVSVELGKRNFEDTKDLLAIQVWLSGTRKAKYSNNNMLAFLAIGVFVGYMIQGFIGSKVSFLNTRFPVGIFLGMVVAIVIEEIWRRKK